MMSASLPASRLTRPTWAFFAALALLAIAGGGLLFYATPQGLGLNDDSIAYIAGARSLLSGQGYREIWIVSAGFVTHFPPGLSAALAFFSLVTGIDPLRAARLLNILLFSFNTFLIGWLALRMTKSRILSLFTAALFVFTPSILRIHSNAMSEPLYIFFTLLTFLSLDYYFTQQDKKLNWLWLILAGSLTGLAYLTRYAALALLATGIVALIILHDEWRKRLIGAGILLTGFIPWAAAWAIRNEIVGGSLTNRGIGWHPIVAENARTGIRTFSEFIMPVISWQLSLVKVDWLFETILIVLGLVLLAWTLKTGLPRFFQPEKNSQSETISFLNGLYIFGYFLSLVVTMTFFDPATKFQLRIISPILVSLLVMLAYGLSRPTKTRGRRVVWDVMALVLTVSLIGSVGSVQELHHGGQVYANERWYDAPALAALRQLPADVAIHSNQPGVIYLYVGRGGSLLPEDAAGMLDLQTQVRAGKAVIAIFKDANADAAAQAYYDALGQGLREEKYNGDVIYSAP
jgi:4-amino-4-deoxy-L-arabinose transferase-like glycosyltransferase